MFIAPIPPPINGQSLASSVFYHSLVRRHDIYLVNTSRQHKSGLLRRVAEVFMILIQIIRSRDSDVIYLTISESISGNIKDLFTYLICFRKLDSMFLHLHGGAGMINILSNKILRSLNAIFLKRVRAVIVLGDTHKVLYDSLIPSKKIYVIPNFAEDYLFIDEPSLEQKFEKMELINVLFVSNLVRGKGFIELVQAYKLLEPHLQNKLTLHFAGSFNDAGIQDMFLSQIRDLPNIHYHGVVHGQEKKDLFHSAHIFCLPTYFPFEGQPISILEAYASGCAVITTDHSGIKDIFSNEINGFFVEKKSPTSIKHALELIYFRGAPLLIPIAKNNFETAKAKYRQSSYVKKLCDVIEL